MSTPTDNKYPQEPGLYWAKRYAKFDEFNLIIKLIGHKPFLKIDWALSLTNGDRFLNPDEAHEYIYGPKVLIPIVLPQ